MSVTIDKLIRSKRKTVGLEVTPEALLIVRAPRNLSQKEIYEIVDKESRWILKNQHFFRANQSRIREKNFVEGEKFLFIGRSYRLRIVSNAPRKLTVDDKFFYLSEEWIDSAREIIESWYRQRANEVVSERAEYYSQLSGIKFKRVNITNAKKRWGSCGARGQLNVAWRLVMAPLRVIDYVIVHELSHIKVRKHSASFWRTVEMTIPGYKLDEKWLRDNGHFLVL